METRYAVEGGSSARTGTRESGEASDRVQRPEEVVKRIMTRLAERVGEGRYERYFDPSTRVSYSNGALDVAVKSGFMAELLDRRFGSDLKTAARDVLGADGPADGPTLHFRVDGELAAPAIPAEPAARLAKPVARKNTRTGSGSPALRHRLDDFVIGAANRLAYSAAVQLAESTDGRRLGPLFIHGACGMGKTHLLQGLAHRFSQTHAGTKVRYTTAESFTNEFISAVRAGNVDAFRKTYRNVDLLCLDDVHFLSNKEATQQELLHTFDTIDLDGSRLALASDEHPREITKLSAQLVSRFMSGVVVRLEPPDAEMRPRLVAQLALRRELVMEDAAIALLAERSARSIGALGGFGGSVREIEGLLTQVEAVFRLLPDLAGADAKTGRIGLVLVRKALGLADGESVDGLARPRRPIQIESISAHVCRALRVDLGEMMGRGRHARVVLARSMVAYLARRMTTLSFPEIARAMGRPNHSTVITAQKRLTEQMAREARGEVIPEAAAELPGTTLREVVNALTREITRAG